MSQSSPRSALPLHRDHVKQPAQQNGIGCNGWRKFPLAALPVKKSADVIFHRCPLNAPQSHYAIQSKLIPPSGIATDLDHHPSERLSFFSSFY